MAPKWQLAIYWPDVDATTEEAACKGKSLWVKCGPPHQASGYAPNGDLVKTNPAVETNLRNARVVLLVSIRVLELMPEFAADIPPIEYTEWLAQPPQQRRRA